MKSLLTLLLSFCLYCANAQDCHDNFLGFGVSTSITSGTGIGANAEISYFKPAPLFYPSIVGSYHKSASNDTANYGFKKYYEVGGRLNFNVYRFNKVNVLAVAPGIKYINAKEMTTVKNTLRNGFYPTLAANYSAQLTTLGEKWAVYVVGEIETVLTLSSNHKLSLGFIFVTGW